MEADIIEALDFNLIMGTSYRFFEPFAKISGMDNKNFYLAQYVLELSLLDVRFLEYKPSLIGSAVIYLINKIRKRT
jgi:cyclin B